MTDFGLLEPGAHRVVGLADDLALVRAMATVEVAWLRALGKGTTEQIDAVAVTVASWQPDLAELGSIGEAGGNPVLPVVHQLRELVARQDSSAAALLHRGLTSQDVLDSALMLVASAVIDRVMFDLAVVVRKLGELAEQHRDAVMPGRTLTQYAVPITFGLKAAQWLAGTLDAADRLEAVQVPAQCGGAAGTLGLTQELVDEPLRAAELFAHEMGLHWPGMPWHTRRSPVTAVSDGLVGVCDALGVIASDVAVLSRPEIGELAEGGAGGISSTMPGKRNPVLSVLVRAAALQAPLLAAQLHQAAATAVDERPDGAWHSEWPSLRRLLVLTATATAQTADLVMHLQVSPDVMDRRTQENARRLLGERGTGTVPSSYLGATSALIDYALGRLASWEEKNRD